MRRKLIKVGIFLTAAVLIVVSAILIRYYYVFSVLIDQKLVRQGGFSETEIFAAPFRIWPGRRIAQPELIQLLRHMGYADHSTHAGRDMSTYAAADNGITIYNDSRLPVDAALAVAVSWSGKTIRSLVNLRNMQELASLSLRPELLSNAIGKSREKRRYIPYKEIPRAVVNAILAAEDRRFFSHSGVDPFRIIGALWVDLRKGDTVQGASTLTQQFAKNYFLTPERTWRRKLQDAYLSILLEQRLTKEQIFELYCNDVYLGQRASFSIVGIGEAAEAYFDKNVKDLSLGEAAMLAGIIRAPNRFTPLRYPERARTRRDLILDEMAQDGMINAAQLQEEKAKPLGVKPAVIQNYSDAPYFVDYIQDFLLERLGDVDLSRSRFRVYTTLHPELQQAAYEAVRQGLAEVDAALARSKRRIAPGTVQASLIAVDPRNGHVLAMIGGRDYGQSQFNRITQAKRQPGSIFKPFVYTAALETAYQSSAPLTAVSTVVDEPTQFAFENLVYEPKNYKDEYQGQVTMRQAITKSLNVATIKFAEKVGYTKIAELAQRLRLNALIKPYPAMAIGAFEVTPLEMVRAYTAFANGGLLNELTPVLKIADAQFRPVFTALPKSEEVLSPQIAFMITSLLESVMNDGTGAQVRTRGFSLPAAGKTGTSRDGWFAGYTPDMLCIAWVGFDDNRELNLSGAQAALPIWTEFMKRASSITPLTGEPFPLPEEIAQVEIDPTTGLLATPRCLERLDELFIRGTEPAISCYGNSYEQMLSPGTMNPYAAPPKENPAPPEAKPSPRNEERKPPTGNPN